MSKVKSLCFALPLLLILSIVSGQNVTNCYFCEETDTICKDPVNVASLPSHRCEDLLYITPRVATDSEAPPKDLSDLLEDVYREDVAVRALGSSSADTYQCIKLSVTWNGTAGVYRSCVIKSKDEKTCEFITEQVKDTYNVSACAVCEGDNCNVSASLALPALVSLLLLSIIKMFVV